MKATIRILSLTLLLLSPITALYAQEGGFQYPFEYTIGYDAKDRPRHKEAGKASQKIASSFKVDLLPWFWVKIANDDFVWKRTEGEGSTNGVGNTRLTFNADAITEDSTGVKAHPALSFIYTIKLPTGRTTKKLGTGRVDHEVLVEVAKSFGDAAIVNGSVAKRTNFAVDVGGYFAGNPGTSGFTNVVEVSMSLTHILDDLKKKKYKYYGEIDYSGPAKDTLSEVFALNELRIKLSDKFRFKVGLRTGLTPNSPRIGVYGSVTYSGRFRPEP